MVKTIEVNERCRIRVYSDIFKGKELLSVRKFWLNEDTGDWKPGKGVTFNYEEIEEIIEGLGLLKEYLES